MSSFEHKKYRKIKYTLCDYFMYFQYLPAVSRYSSGIDCAFKNLAFFSLNVE